MTDGGSAPPQEIVVVRDGHGLPYSKGLMAQSIMATGVAPARSYELARRIESRLAELAEGEIAASRLSLVAEEVLGVEEGAGAVRRFRQWKKLDRLERPLVVLIGGTAGTGKSTLASLLAHRLGINRLIATDVIRHVLRAFFAPEVMPDVHRSSFEAGSAVVLPTEGDDPDLLGFRTQAGHVASGARAIVERAVIERTPIILEGVHLVPGVLPASLWERALVVQVVLAVEDEAMHRSHFQMRGEAQSRGPVGRYLDRLDTIRKLQSFLVERARLAGVPVLANESLDTSLSALMDLVLEAVAQAEDVAGERAGAAVGARS